MRLSTILVLVLAVAFAAANPLALLIKRDSTSSMTSTASTDLPATYITWAETLITGIDSSSSPYTSTDWFETTLTVDTDPSEPTPGPSDDDQDGIPGSDSVMKACSPRDAIGYIDFNSPCNQLNAILAQCFYGPRALVILALPHEGKLPNFKYWQRQPPETERACICQSQLADAVLGCVACYNAHGDPSAGPGIGLIYPPTMQQYCDVDYTATQNFVEFLLNADGFGDDYATTPSPYTGEILSTSIEVSLYYTMSVTRSDAYNIALPTPVSGGDATYTSTRISNGQIVPTAQAEKETREQGPGEAGTSSISTSTSSTSSLSDRVTTSSTSRASSTRSLSIATPSTSQSSFRDDRSEAQVMNGCYPRNATGFFDYNAPCNQAIAIEAQCAYGPPMLQISTFAFDSGEYPAVNPGVPEVSPEAERTCICQSQHIDAAIGCTRCTKAHQIYHQSKDMETYIYAEMEQYCDVDFNTAQSFSEFSLQSSLDFFYDEDAPADPYTAEVISTSTDVSLYYTMSVTRSDAYDVALPTSAYWDGNMIYTSTRISDGQIVPTARTVKDPDSPTTDAGATTNAGVAGLLALAALAAFGL